MTNQSITTSIPSSPAAIQGVGASGSAGNFPAQHLELPYTEVLGDTAWHVDHRPMTPGLIGRLLYLGLFAMIQFWVVLAWHRIFRPDGKPEANEDWRGI